MADLNVGVWKESHRDIKGARKNKRNEEKMIETKKDEKRTRDMKKKQEREK